jgi:hypothetical protein
MLNYLSRILDVVLCNKAALMLMFIVIALLGGDTCPPGA